MNTSKLTIKNKLIILAGTMVVLLFTVGLFSIYTQNNISDNERIKVQFKNISIGTLQLRKAEKDFLLREATNMEFFETGKSKYVAQFDTTLSVIIKTLNELKTTDLVKDNDFNVDDLVKFYKDYNDKFHDLVDLRRQRGELTYGLIGEMRKAVHAVENAQGVNIHLQYQILVLRKIEKDYLLRKDTVYEKKFHETFDRVYSSGIIPAFMTKTMQDYKNAFKEVVKVDKTIGFSESEGIMGGLRSTIHKVEPAVEKMINEVEDIIQTEDARSVMLIYILLIIGLAVASLISFFVIRSIITSMKHAVETLDKISRGNLDFEITIASRDEIGTLLTSMKSMMTKLKEIITGIRMASFNITAASSEMNSSAQQMSEGATEQASSVEEISSSMEQMAANVQQNTDNATQTEKIAKNAVKEISEGNEAVHKTVQSMKTIANKISIIGEIARQTNLLALNAAVEAARAGEHGRGFAVVAAEVRKLAERSQEAAGEINGLSFSSVEVAQKSGELLNNIVPGIQRTAELVQEITAASVEQNSGSEQINSAIQQLNQVVQSNASTAEELAATAQELNAQSEQLTEMISFFNIGETEMKQLNKIKSTKKFEHRNAPATTAPKTKMKVTPEVNQNYKKMVDESDKDYEKVLVF
jgi:methyl-accepting chemotaxis protein